MIQLSYVDAQNAARSVSFERELIRFGRGSACELRLAGASADVAVQHGELVLEKGVYHLVAKDPRYAIWVNGKQVQRCALRGGEKIRLGSPSGPEIQVLQVSLASSAFDARFEEGEATVQVSLVEVAKMQAAARAQVAATVEKLPRLSKPGATPVPPPEDEETLLPLVIGKELPASSPPSKVRPTTPPPPPSIPPVSLPPRATGTPRALAEPAGKREPAVPVGKRVTMQGTPRPPAQTPRPPSQGTPRPPVSAPGSAPRATAQGTPRPPVSAPGSAPRAAAQGTPRPPVSAPGSAPRAAAQGTPRPPRTSAPGAGPDLPLPSPPSEEPTLGVFPLGEHTRSQLDSVPSFPVALGEESGPGGAPVRRNSFAALLQADLHDRDLPAPPVALDKTPMPPAAAAAPPPVPAPPQPPPAAPQKAKPLARALKLLKKPHAEVQQWMLRVQQEVAQARSQTDGLSSGNTMVIMARAMAGIREKAEGRARRARRMMLLLAAVSVTAVIGLSAVIFFQQRKLTALATEKAELDVQIQKTLDAMTTETDEEKLAELEGRLQQLMGSASEKILEVKRANARRGEELAKPTDPLEEEIRKILRSFSAETYAIPPIFKAALQKQVTELSGSPSLRAAYARKQRYWPQIEGALRKRQLPEELGYIAFTESGFDPQAHNPKSQAAGMWQLMDETARNCGVTVNAKADDRLDPARSSDAAACYLSKLLVEFGEESFMLALASYNRGENGVRRALHKLAMQPGGYKKRDFWHLYRLKLLPEETRDYVPKVLAAAIVLGNPQKYGLARTN